jgi:dolichol-phosphate mannosyltransferase
MPNSRAVVVIPTLNERRTVADIIARVLAQQENVSGFDLNVLIVDGASTDGTIEYVSGLSHEDSRVHLLIVGQRGLGLALLSAYQHATRELSATHIVQMDADLSHDPVHIPELLQALSQGFDLSIGSRYAPGGGTVDWPFSRKLQSLLANRYATLASGYSDVREWTSGYRAFTTDLYHKLDIEAIRYNDYTLQPALVLEALRNGARMQEVPITFVNRKWGKSKLPLARYTFHLLRHFALSRRRSAEARQPWPSPARE